MRQPTIDYQLLGVASRYYQDLGYKYIEAPWYTSEEAINATLPPSKGVWHAALSNTLNHQQGGGYSLVGSAEQSLLGMLLEDRLPIGNYQAITPCWRDDVCDPLHQQYFMKLELMVVISTPSLPVPRSLQVGHEYLKRMLNDATSFFSQYLNVGIAEKGDGLDIVSAIEHIELGSYGIRQYRGNTWVYGTGIAEPRCSITMQRESLPK